MRQMGLASNRPYRKCAKIVGEVIGNYHPHYEFRSNPYGRGKGRGPGGGGGRVREAEPTDDYAHEDRSVAFGVRAGMRVRHAQFGVGSVIAVEEHGDDLKITVRFNAVGVKKLLGKYAKLEPA